MEDDAAEGYNSDSGDGDFQMESASDDDRGKSGDEDEGNIRDGWIQWFTTLEGH